MSADILKQELQAFMEAWPETRFMDVFSPDINGVPRGKRIPVEDFGKVFGKGANFCAASALMHTKGEAPENVVYGAHDGDPDVKSIAVAGSLAPVPWAEIPTAQCLLELTEFDGTPFFLDPRNVLRKALQPLKDMGLHPVMAQELEFYLVRHDGTSFVPRLPTIPGSNLPQTGIQYSCFEDLDDVEPFLVDLDKFCRAQNIPAGAALSEYSPGQFEVNLNHVDDPALACDHAILLKRAVKAAARKNGMAATFMAKPFAEHAGSGMHMHISLLDDDGNNIFSGKSKDGDFSDSLRHAIGGLVEVMPESMAVFAPNANSYRRIVPGASAPFSRAWGIDNRTAAIRVLNQEPESTRTELRSCGGDVNLYLGLAALLSAGVDGIRNQTDPGPPAKGDLDEQDIARLPQNWGDALDASDWARHAFGKDFYPNYRTIKRYEYDRFRRTVTDTERDL